MSSRSGGLHLGRAVGALLVVGTLLTGPLAGTGQAADLTSYAGQGSGFALRVVVDLSVLPDAVKTPIQDAYEELRDSLPADLQSHLPAKFNFKIDQRFIETLAEIGATNKAQAFLGTGFDKAAEATKGGDDVKESFAKRQLPSSSMPVLDISAGDLNASVSGGPTAAGDGALSSVAVTLEDIGKLLPPQIQDLWNQLVDLINDAIGSLDTTLDTTLETVADQVNQVCETAGSSVGDTVDSLVPGVGSEVQQTLEDEVCTNQTVENVVTNVTELTDTVGLGTISDPLDSRLAFIGGLVNKSLAKRDGNTSVATASSKLAEVKVLNLLRVGAIELSSRSEAAGVKGSAKNSRTCEISDVRVGSADNGISLDGKNLYVNNEVVPVPTSEVDDMKNTVKGVLAAAHLSIDLCDTAAHEEAGDGTSASQTVSAFRVEFTPTAPADVPVLDIDQGDALAKIIIDPSVETSVSAEVGGTSPTGGTTTPTTTTTTTTPRTAPELPHTGAGTTATVIVGSALAAAGLILRRRFV